MKAKTTNDEQFLINIFQKYHNAKLWFDKTETAVLHEVTGFYPTLKHETAAKNYQQHCEIVNTILAILPKNEYILIVKQFIKPEKNWWKQFYTYHDFQKLKHRAIKRFLYLYLV